jgi:hypothetical protein
MISIQSSLTELERSHRQLEVVLDCYITALRNIGQYALELDEDLTSHYRLHLMSLADAMHRGGANSRAAGRRSTDSCAIFATGVPTMSQICAMNQPTRHGHSKRFLTR